MLCNIYEKKNNGKDKLAITLIQDDNDNDKICK